MKGHGHMKSPQTDMDNTTTDKKSKRTIIILAAVAAVLLFVIAGMLAWYFTRSREAGTGASAPVVRINTGERVPAGDGEIEVPVTLSDMPSGILFPAASFSITFDNYKLELVGLKQGNVEVLADENAQGNHLALPEWSLNRDYANQSGRINVMYFDSTAGRYAFTAEGFDAENATLLFTLIFRLRTNVRAGEIFDLVMGDAVFAASDETKSLALTQDTLRAENGKIIVAGE